MTRRAFGEPGTHTGNRFASKYDVALAHTTQHVRACTDELSVMRFAESAISPLPIGSASARPL